MSDPNLQDTQITPGNKGRNRKKIIVWSAAALLFILIIFVIAAIWLPKKIKNQNEKNSLTTHETVEPKFVKEGELFFLDKSDSSKHKKIDVEIADDEATRNRGLMFRRSMADTVGMLFIFEDSQPRSFWMENTYIPLDIIYGDENSEIITIQKNAVPFSEASIPSKGNAKYVIEVNAGFSDNNKLKKGDRIRFARGK